MDETCPSAPSVTTASTADTWKSSSATMYVPYVAMMVSVISAMGVLYMYRSQVAVAIPKAKPVSGPPMASCRNSLHRKGMQSQTGQQP